MADNKESARKNQNRKRVRQNIFDTSRGIPVPKKRPLLRTNKKMANAQDGNHSMRDLTHGQPVPRSGEPSQELTKNQNTNSNIIDFSHTINTARINSGAIPKVPRGNVVDINPYIRNVVSESVDHMRKSVESSVRNELDGITKSLDTLTSLVHRLTVNDKRASQAKNSAKTHNSPAGTVSGVTHTLQSPQGATGGHPLMPSFSVPPPNYEQQRTENQAYIHLQIIYNHMSQGPIMYLK